MNRGKSLNNLFNIINHLHPTDNPLLVENIYPSKYYRRIENIHSQELFAKMIVLRYKTMIKFPNAKSLIE